MVARASARGIALILLMALLFVSGGMGVLFYLLQFPPNISAIFGGVMGLQATILLWFAMRLHTRIQDGIAEARYQHDRLWLRALITGVLVLLGGLGFLLYTPSQVWYRTLVLLTLALLGMYSAVSFFIVFLLRAELSGRIAHGFAERWIARIAAISVMTTGVFVFALFDFLGGIYWWHQHYVTEAKRREVLDRNDLLKSIQLTSLFDRENRYLGVFTRTESDWIQKYNDPKLLDWKLSKTIAIAEGKVSEPAWWWRYLPDGERLKCEPFAIEAFLRMPYYMIKQRRKVGGSTPALQAAKNFLDFGQKRQNLGLFSTVSSKLFDEMPRSYIMCQAFSPREMMAIYQATIWTGQSANYGAHRMAMYYFNLDDPSLLDWNQAVVVAASLPNPGRLNPWYLKACRAGRCEDERRSRVYAVWKERIAQLKGRLRAQGIKIPKELPRFENGLGKLRAISQEWKTHDLHIRHWIERSMPKEIKDWQRGARIQLYYDRELTIGKDGKAGLLTVAEQAFAPFREQLDELQLAYTLVDGQSGEIASQYGGDAHVDMALAQKPVVGSVFKVFTALVMPHWPDQLPLVNKGQQGSRRRFVYHPSGKNQGHLVRNSVKMPPFVNKEQALAISANIAFVYLSLRWTWMLDDTTWERIFTQALTHLLEDKKKLPPADALREAERLQKAPEEMRKLLIREFGYQPYFADLRQRAIFEAAKAATVKALLPEAATEQKKLDDNEAKKQAALEQRKKLRTPEEILAELSPDDDAARKNNGTTAPTSPTAPTTPPPANTTGIPKPTVAPAAPVEPPVTATQLAEFLDVEHDDFFPSNPKIQRTFQEKKKLFEGRFTGELSLAELGWVRELRMEMGLRYIALLAEKIGGFDRKKSNLVPVLTMTLGVNDADTKQLAAAAAYLATGKLIRPALIQRVERDNDLRLPEKPAIFPSPLADEYPAAVRKLMQAVLRKDKKGTASGAGAALAKRFGDAILDQAGAKTGTVQSTKGVSCIGFVGHLAGAVTLSTPQNDPLKTFRIKRALTQQKSRAEKLHQLWLKRYERAREGTRIARIALQRTEQYERQSREAEKRITEAKELGKRYHQLRKQLKAAEKMAETLDKKAARLAQKSRRALKRAAVHQKKLRLLGQRRRRIYEQLQQLPPPERRDARQKQRAETLQQSIKETEQNYALHMTAYQEASQFQQESAQKIRELRQQATEQRLAMRQANDEHKRLTPAFRRVHEPWTLSSSQACRILFSLLGEWKEYNDKRPVAQVQAQAPTQPQAPTQAPVKTKEIAPVLPSSAAPPLAPTDPRSLSPNAPRPTDPRLPTLPRPPSQETTPTPRPSDAGTDEDGLPKIPVLRLPPPPPRIRSED